MQGKVKMFNKEKGYGFIKLSDGRDVLDVYKRQPMPILIIPVNAAYLIKCI